MKGVLKLILLIAIVLFALTDYRILSFSTGFSQKSMEGKNIIEFFQTVSKISKVEYYEFEQYIDGKTYEYKVYLETESVGYLLDATDDDINGLKGLSMFSGNLKPERVSPIPYWVEIIVGLIVLLFPEPKSKESKGKEVETEVKLKENK